MATVWVVGIGPGSENGMTGQALAALSMADVVCGYSVYIDLVKALIPGKPIISTGMTREVERCRQALQTATAGQSVAVVCSGDSGVYGMAGLLYELAGEYDGVEIQVVPGVSAAMAGAALLGAPLMTDFAVISLSDLLTPWEVIGNRVRAAAVADFVICLYNPASKRRRDHLSRACHIILETRSPATVCGWTRNIGREGQDHGLLSLAALRDWPADMFCTLFVGNSATRESNGKMVTIRGYRGIGP